MITQRILIIIYIICSQCFKASYNFSDCNLRDLDISFFIFFEIKKCTPNYRDIQLMYILIIYFIDSKLHKMCIEDSFNKLMFRVYLKHSYLEMEFIIFCKILSFHDLMVITAFQLLKQQKLNIQIWILQSKSISKKMRLQQIFNHALLHYHNNFAKAFCALDVAF